MASWSSWVCGVVGERGNAAAAEGEGHVQHGLCYQPRRCHKARISGVFCRRARVRVWSDQAHAHAHDVYGLPAAAAPGHVPGGFTPDVAPLVLAVTATDLACPTGAELLQYKGLHQRHLPEVTCRGRVEHPISQYAL